MGDSIPVDKNTDDEIDSLQSGSSSSQVKELESVTSSGASSGDGTFQHTATIINRLPPKPTASPTNLRQVARERRLSAFFEANRRASDLQSSNKSIQEEIEAKRIAPRLARMVGQSMRELNDALATLALDDEHDEYSISSDSMYLAQASFHDGRRYSETNSVLSQVGTTALQKEVTLTPADEAIPQLPNNGNHRLSAVPPSKRAHRSSHSHLASETVMKEDEGERSDDAESFSSSGPIFPSSKVTMTPLESRSKTGITPIAKANNRNLEKLGFLLLICGTIIFAILSATSASTAPKGLPLISNGNKTLRSFTSLPMLSDGKLHSSFEALVGDDIRTPGSAQYFASWWIMEKDPLRHRSTLERLEQRFLLACFYFASTNNCNVPWLSCNSELASSLSSITYAKVLGDRPIHQVGTLYETAPAKSTKNSSSSVQACEIMKPLYDGHGHISGYQMMKALQWLSKYSECDWAGITCKLEETDDLGLDKKFSYNPVVEINLEGQIQYETIVTEILQLPDLELLMY